MFCRMLCANPDCDGKSPLQDDIAPPFVCAYFGLPHERAKTVCQECFKKAEDHQNILVKMLVDGQSIVHGPKKPRNQMVTIDDEEEVAVGDVERKIRDIVVVDGDVEIQIQDIMKKYNFSHQVQEYNSYLEKRFADSKEKMMELDAIHNNLEKTLDAFREQLYSPHEPQIQHLDPVDIDACGVAVNHQCTEKSNTGIHPDAKATARDHPLPPVGDFVYTPVKINQAVYAMRSSLLSPWGKGRVIRMKMTNSEQLYVVRFDTGGKPRTFPLKYLAYAEPSPVQLNVGSRVIAQYVEDKDGKLKPSSYYAGVIAESPKYLNNYRYLVFFDDGYAQYCTHQQVIMVCNSSRDVWHDIHMNSRSFISNYLKQFPERAMVKLQRGQSVKTELDGNWFQGRVERVDASLAYIHFFSENRYEWIYRGSTRLHPLFELLANAEARKSQGATRPTHNMALVHKKKNAPYVEYTRGDSDFCNTPATSSVPATSSEQLPSAKTESTIRAVARKSTSKAAMSKSLPVPAVPPRERTEDGYVSAEHKGRTKKRVNEYHQAVLFEPHQCCNNCVKEFPYKEGDYKNQNPLSIPMFCGWSREVTKQRCGRPSIVYRAPCGRRMRNMDEVHRYLRLTGCQLSVDLFCYDSFVHCFTEFEPEIVYSKINDITYGKENVRVSCVNSIDRSNPEYVEYSTERTPREGVDMNLDPSFLVCCDCTDDCQDKDKCACWQLTLNSTSAATGKVDPNAGYQYRRLMQNVITGVYECNSRCSCRKTCLNRVAQRPLQLRLQLFRTDKRGWGIRCLDDIPKGEFICVYTGQILTDQNANDNGKELGDEYLAELDLIETIEQAKDGYESDVDISIDQPCSNSSQSSSSDEESDANSEISESGANSSRPSKGQVSKKEEKTHSQLLVNSFLTKLPAATKTAWLSDKEIALKKTRELYGANEHCYVMDAKSTGNIGRYLNHCCKPNVFVQNVFVDTQDLRFPWVAFFAHCFIRAGTELTWDYSYQVGSVPEKILYCYCGAKECRGRLL